MEATAFIKDLLFWKFNGNRDKIELQEDYFFLYKVTYY